MRRLCWGWGWLLGLQVALAAPPTIVTLPLEWSNAYLIKGPRPVLVDVGGKLDGPKLQAGLEAQGVLLQELALIVLTHAHADHAGGVAWLRERTRAPVAMGSRDVALAAAGHHGDLRPTGFWAGLLKHFALDPRYPPFKPDIVVHDRLSLAPWDLDGELRQMPGHTAGSLVLLLKDGRAMVGDMVMGGWFGGAAFPETPTEHYFHADPVHNRRQIRTLLELGVQTWYLGHGGPVTFDAVNRAFAR